MTLTAEERLTLEALTGSRKSEAQMRDRARIVLLAASGLGSRAIAREMGCTPGMASKWRVRFARDRMAGLREAGDRGAERKYGPEHDRRILSFLRSRGSRRKSRVDIVLSLQCSQRLPQHRKLLVSL